MMFNSTNFRMLESGSSNHPKILLFMPIFKHMLEINARRNPSTAKDGEGCILCYGYTILEHSALVFMIPQRAPKMTVSTP